MPRTCCFRSWTWWKGLQYGSMLCLAADLKREVWAKLRRDFWGAFLLGSERLFFSNHGSQGRETLRFIIRFLGIFPSNPKRGISPSNHHKTVGSIWLSPHLSPHIFRNCCKLLAKHPRKIRNGIPRWIYAGKDLTKGTGWTTGWGECSKSIPPKKRGREHVLLKPTRSVASGNWCASNLITWFETPALSLLLLSS